MFFKAQDMGDKKVLRTSAMEALPSNTNLIKKNMPRDFTIFCAANAKILEDMISNTSCNYNVLLPVSKVLLSFFETCELSQMKRFAFNYLFSDLPFGQLAYYPMDSISYAKGSVYDHFCNGTLRELFKTMSRYPIVKESASGGEDTLSDIEISLDSILQPAYFTIFLFECCLLYLNKSMEDKLIGKESNADLKKTESSFILWDPSLFLKQFSDQITAPFAMNISMRRKHQEDLVEHLFSSKKHSTIEFDSPEKIEVLVKNRIKTYEKEVEENARELISLYENQLLFVCEAMKDTGFKMLDWGRVKIESPVLVQNLARASELRKLHIGRNLYAVYNRYLNDILYSERFMNDNQIEKQYSSNMLIVYMQDKQMFDEQTLPQRIINEYSPMQRSMHRLEKLRPREENGLLFGAEESLQNRKNVFVKIDLKGAEGKDSVLSLQKSKIDVKKFDEEISEITSSISSLSISSMATATISSDLSKRKSQISVQELKNKREDLHERYILCLLLEKTLRTESQNLIQ